MPAGALVTDNEVLAGRFNHRNGPRLARQLLAMGIDVGNLSVYVQTDPRT